VLLGSYRNISMKTFYKLIPVVLFASLGSCSPESGEVSKANKNDAKIHQSPGFPKVEKKRDDSHQALDPKKTRYTRKEATEVAAALGRESDPQQWLKNLAQIAALNRKVEGGGFGALNDFMESAYGSHSLPELVDMLHSVPEELFFHLDKEMANKNDPGWKELITTMFGKFQQEHGVEIANAEPVKKIVDQLPSGPVANSIKANVHFGAIRSANLDSALDNITAIQDPVVRGQTTALYLNAKAEFQPIPVLERFLQGDERIPTELDMISEVFRRNGKFTQYATEVSTMIRDSKPSRQRDVASVGLVGALAYGDEPAAREWTDQIQNPELKGQAMIEIYKARFQKVQLGIPIEGELP